MEDFFIQLMFKLTEEILRGEREFEPTKELLLSHIPKAQKIGSLRYEAEVLNTLGILYLISGRTDEHFSYFLQGLEKARQTADTDLKMKILNNLSEISLNVWDMDNASTYIDEGIELGRQHNLNTLVLLYLYSNKLNYLIMRGDFEAAAALLDEAWQRADHADMLKYSRYEYFQVVFIFRNSGIVVDVARGRCEAVLTNLNLVTQFIGDTKNVEFHISAHISHVYYELLCSHDEQAARHWEGVALEAAGGKLAWNIALNIATFMMHNRQREWAGKYARLALEQSSADQLLPKPALEQIEQVLRQPA